MRSTLFFKNRNQRRDRMLRKMENMRAAKERKRLERGPRDEELKLVRFFKLEFGVRDKRNGDTVWMDLKSTRDVAKRIAVLLKHYT